MIIKKGKFKGVFVFELESHKDHRGFFMRTYDGKLFEKYGLQRKWVQENQSYSRKKGTIRGMHFQLSPYSEAKLIRVLQGKIFKAYIDLRKGSATFGKWGSIILSGDNKKMLYVPRGFALGMCSLADHCVVLYKIDNYYSPKKQGAIKWDDPDLGIAWPLDRRPILSKRDAAAGSFKEFVKTHGAINK